MESRPAIDHNVTVDKRKPCLHPITTGLFKLTSAEYLRADASSALTRLSLAFGLPVIACFIAAAWDVRWAFVGLIIIFLIFPMTISYIYFWRLLSPEASRSLARKSVTITPGHSVTVTYTPEDESSSPLPVRSIPWDYITDISLISRLLVIRTLNSAQPLIIPLQAIPESYPLYDLCYHNSCRQA